jgi:hypothetical protein
LDIAFDKLTLEENKYQNDLIDDSRLLESILNEGNVPCENKTSTCYFKYMAYKTKYQRLMLTEESSKKVFKAHQNHNFTASLEKDRLKTQYLLDSNASKKFFFETITALQKSIDEIGHRLKDIEYQKQKIRHDILQCKIRAPISGTIQVLHPLNTNEYLPMGESVLRIIPDSVDTYKMEMIVQNNDIGKIRLDQKVKYKILTFNYKEYGTMNGHIIKISKDSTSKGYKVMGSVEGTKIVGAAGKVGTLMAGMLFESKIIVFKKRILSFLIEQLNVFSDFAFPAD